MSFGGLRRDLGGGMSEHHMGMNTPLPGARHASCSELYTITTESAWLAPLVLFMSFMGPYAWRIRWDGRRLQDPKLLRTGQFLIMIQWSLVLLFALFANSEVQHAQGVNDAGHFKMYQMLSIWLFALPVYLFLRDTIRTSAFCCNARGNWSCFCAPCNAFYALWARFLPPVSSVQSESSDESLNSAAVQVNGRTFAIFFGEFWEWAMMGLASLAIPWLCMWQMYQCFNLFNEVGHWVPFLAFAAYAGCLLIFSSPSQANSLNLQLTEGWLWVFFGIIFNIYMSLVGPGAGGFFQFWARYASSDPTEWLFEQQHFFMTFTDILCGTASILLARSNVKSGIPMLLLGALNWYNLSEHPQPCNLALLLHRYTGYWFLFMGIARYLNRNLEASLLMLFSGATFLAASPCSVTFFDGSFTISGTFFLVYGYHGMLWATVLYVNRDYVYGESNVELLCSAAPEDITTVYPKLNNHNNSPTRKLQTNGHHDSPSYNKIETINGI